MRISQLVASLALLALVQGCGATVAEPPTRDRMLTDARADADLVVHFDLVRYRASTLRERGLVPEAELVVEWDLEACGVDASAFDSVTFSVAELGVELAVRGGTRVEPCLRALAARLGAPQLAREGRLLRERGRSTLVLGAPAPRLATDARASRLRAASGRDAVVSVYADLTRRELPTELTRALGIGPRSLGILRQDARVLATVDATPAGESSLQVQVEVGDDERAGLMASLFEDRLRAQATLFAASLGPLLTDVGSPSPETDAARLGASLAAMQLEARERTFVLGLALPRDTAASVGLLVAAQARAEVMAARVDRAKRNVVAIADALESYAATVPRGARLFPGTLVQVPRETPTGAPRVMREEDFPGAWQRLAFRPVGHQVFAFGALVGRYDYRVYAVADLDGDGEAGTIVLEGTLVSGVPERQPLAYDRPLE